MKLKKSLLLGKKAMKNPDSVLKIKDIGSWIYLWAFYSVPLIYISDFVPVPYCLDDCGFEV